MYLCTFDQKEKPKAAMKWRDIEARIKRLEELTRGLDKEHRFIEKDQFPLHYVERTDYLAAIRKMIQGSEEARVTLVKAWQRNDADAS
jgi:hypothetical protein